MTGSVIGALRVTLGIDTAAWESGLSQAQRSLNAAGKRLQAIGDRMTGIGKGMSLAITAPLVAFGAASFKAASDAAELQGSFDQTFGDMADEMNAWAEATGDAMGRSTQAIQEAANTFGIFFNQAAPTRREAAEMSRTFAVLAQDLASFYNVSESDALQKLRSGLSGEAEPLRDFGVFLSAAAVEAKALELGLGSLGGELSEQDKIMARYALILENTTNAQGDVARTSGNTANQIRTAQAAFQELQVTVGTKLLPVLTPLITKLAGLLDAFSGLPDGMQTFIVSAAAVAAAGGPVLLVLGQVVSAIGALLPVFAPVVALIGEAGLAGAFGALGTVIAPALPVIAAVAAAGALIHANWDKIAPVLQRLWAQVQATLGPALASLIGTVKAVLTDLWNGPFGEAIRVVMGILGQFAAAYGEILGTVLIRILTALVTAVEGAFKLIGDALRFVAALLSGDFRGAWEAAKSFVVNAVNGILAILRALAPEAMAAVERLVTGVRDWMVGRLGAIWDSVKSKIDWIKNAFFNLYDAVVGHSYIPDLFDGIARHAVRFLPEFVSPVLAGIGQVSSAFRGLGEADVRLPQIVVTAPASDGGADNDGSSAAGRETQNDLQEAFRRTFTDGIKAALSGDLKGFFQKWFEGVGNRALENIAGSLSDLLFNAFGNAFGGGGGGGGLFSSIFSTIFGRLSGGPVLANTPYIVGEKRPELFIPSTAGRIEPDLSALGRGHRAEADGPSTLNFNFDGSVTNPQEVRRSAAQAGAQLIRMMGEGKRGV